MKDFCTFTDGHREEIIHYCRTGDNNEIKFMTPSGYYMYKEEPREPYFFECDKVYLPTIKTHSFWKYDKSEAEFYSIIRRTIRANWHEVDNIESISLSIPD